MPTWKIDFLEKYAKFYTAHGGPIDSWTKDSGVYPEAFPPSRRGLEWQAQDTPRFYGAVVHLQASGTRAKRSTYVPAFVAITQTSIVGSRGRRLSVREGARLQGLPREFIFCDQPDAVSFRQLGNGVSVGSVRHVLRQHARQDA